VKEAAVMTSSYSAANGIAAVGIPSSPLSRLVVPMLAAAIVLALGLLLVQLSSSSAQLDERPPAAIESPAN